MGRTPAGETRERIYRFVRDRLLGGFPPTVREVKEAFGFRSVQTAREHLEALVTEGRLAKEAGKARGYRLGGDSRPTRLVPLLGRVPAGPLNIATEDLEGYLPIQGHRSSDDLFGLRVRGESMTGAGILPGDIVVALIGGEATVKRLRIRRNRVELHPENPAFESIIPDPSELTLLGKVIEVRRYLERP
jgi:repressor LexA